MEIMAMTKLALRATQFVFAVIVLGTAAASQQRLFYDYSESSTGFAIFVAVTSILITAAHILIALRRPAFMDRACPKSKLAPVTIWAITWVCVDALWCIFWLAAAASLSPWTQYASWLASFSFSGAKAAGSTFQATCAFSWLSWFAWIATLVLVILDLVRALRGGGKAGAAPVEDAAAAKATVATPAEAKADKTEGEEPKAADAV